MASDPPRPRRRHHLRIWVGLVAGIVLSLLGAAAVAEYLGWPFLARPAERWLTQKLERPVRFADATDGARAFRLKLLGGIRLELARLRIDNAPWSRLGPMFVAEDAAFAVRWRDLLERRRSAGPLTLKELSARRLTLELERNDDGHASWQFGKRQQAEQDAGGPAIDGVRVEQLGLGEGTVKIVDAMNRLDLQGSYTSRTGADGQPGGVLAQAAGLWRDARFTMKLDAQSPLPWPGGDIETPPVPIDLRVDAVHAKLHFNGTVRDLFGRRGLEGRYEASGPSLAAIGQLFGITLPTTREFALRGRITRSGDHWSTAIDRATIGRSRLAGDFTLDRPPATVPMLRGELRGAALWLADLGPAIGVPTGAPPARERERVLPRRNFNLPSLKAMNADVKVALDRLELGHPRLSSIRPLQAHIVLKDSVLAIDDIDAKLARGRIAGRIRLDAQQGEVARWDVALDARGLRLEEWIAQPRADGRPPYATGRIAGHIELKGQGRSTAELLASSDGRGWVLWSRGTMSHLVVEAAGLDIAQSLGVMIRGDKPLQVTCGAADLRVQRGQVAPSVLVVDTTDSTIRGEGFVSLADEELELIARVDPKDTSPLTLRSPLHVKGTLAQPKVSIDKRALARKLAPAALLALAHPLAALLPLFDAGSDDGQDAVSGCQTLVERYGRGGKTG